MIPTCIDPTDIAMYVPRCISSLELDPSPASSTVSHCQGITSGVAGVRAPRVTAASPFVIIWRRILLQIIYCPGFSRGLSRLCISQHHLWIVTMTAVAELYDLSPLRSIIINHSFIINHGIAVCALPINELSHSSSSFNLNGIGFPLGV